MAKNTDKAISRYKEKTMQHYVYKTLAALLTIAFAHIT